MDVQVNDEPGLERFFFFLQRCHSMIVDLISSPHGYWVHFACLVFHGVLLILTHESLRITGIFRFLFTHLFLSSQTCSMLCL